MVICEFQSDFWEYFNNKAGNFVLITDWGHGPKIL